MSRFVIVLALIAVSWAVTLGAIWVALYVSPWIPLGAIVVLVLIAVEPRGLVRR